MRNALARQLIFSKESIFFPRKQFGGVIKFQNQIWFQRGSGTYLHWNCFLFTPAVHAFPCVPIVRDPFCCLKTKHYTPLCVYLMCWFCCPGRERERETGETKKERGLSGRHLRNRNLVSQHKVFVESVVSEEMCRGFIAKPPHGVGRMCDIFARPARVITFLLQANENVHVFEKCQGKLRKSEATRRFSNKNLSLAHLCLNHQSWRGPPKMDCCFRTLVFLRDPWIEQATGTRGEQLVNTRAVKSVHVLSGTKLSKSHRWLPSLRSRLCDECKCR